MWSWYRGEYIIPKIKEWKGYTGKNILPICADGYKKMIYRVRTDDIRRHICKKYFVISTDGIEYLCNYCKFALEKAVDPKLLCTFKGANNRSTPVYWDKETIRDLVSTLEIPIFALMPDPKSPPQIAKLSFKASRILSNVRQLASDITIYDEIDKDAHTHYYTTGTISERSNSREIFRIKIRNLYIKLSSMTLDVLKQKMSTFSI